jgi:hypothetical protein
MLIKTLNIFDIHPLVDFLLHTDGQTWQKLLTIVLRTSLKTKKYKNKKRTGSKDQQKKRTVDNKTSHEGTP